MFPADDEVDLFQGFGRLSGLAATGVGSASGVADPQVGDHFQHVIGGRIAVADEPAPDDSAGTANTAPAVHVDVVATGKVVVNRVEYLDHEFLGGDVHVADRVPVDLGVRFDIGVIVGEVPVGSIRVVLGEVYEPVNTRVEQLFDDLGDSFEFPPALLPGVGACGEPVFDHPVGPPGGPRDPVRGKWIRLNHGGDRFMKFHGVLLFVIRPGLVAGLWISLLPLTGREIHSPAPSTCGVVGFGFLQVVEQVLFTALLFLNCRPAVVTYRTIDTAQC